VARFRLLDVYGVATLDEARDALDRNTNISAAVDELIVIGVTDREPERAAALANAYVEELDRAARARAAGPAARRRPYLERELKAALAGVADAQSALRVAQEKSGLLVLDAQARLLVEATAAAQARLAAAEIEAAALRTAVRPGHPDHLRLLVAIAALRREADRLVVAAAPAEHGVVVPAQQLPAAAGEFTARVRELRYRQELAAMILGQVELARQQEALQVPVVRVLERATPPGSPDPAPRLHAVLLSVLAGTFVAVFFALLADAWRHALADPRQARRLRDLR
jgi:tyrosine-protein kinase Etk/Wzc